MTKPDSDPVGNSTPSSRSRARGPGPILDLDRSRVKDETPPSVSSAEGQASDAAAAVGSSASDTGPMVADSAAASSAPHAGVDASAGPSSEDAAPTPPLPPGQSNPSRRGGFGPLLGASLLGGVIGAGLGLAGERAWRQHAGDPVQARLAQVEQRTESTPSRDVVGALERRVAATEAALKDASDRAREAQSAATAAAARAEEASNRPAPEVPPPPALDTAAIDQIASRLSAIEIEMRNGAQAQDAGIETLGRRIAEQDTRFGALDAKLADAAKADTARDDALQSRLTEAERRAEAQDGRLAALSQEGQQRIAALTQSVDARVADLAKAVAQGRDRDEVRATARLALADRIGRALRDGEPHAPALASLRRLGVRGDGLAALEPYAANGAPRAVDLAREFRPIADRLRAKGQTGDAAPAASWEDRLRRLASSVVSVRPLEGDAHTAFQPADSVASVASALDRGDISGAAKAWDALPEPVRQDAREFGTRLKQRAAAEQAVEGVSHDTLAALDASTQ